MGFYGTAVLPRTSACAAGSAASRRCQRRLVGGRHLTRPIAALVTAAGFTVTELDLFYQEGTPKVTGADSSARRWRPHRLMAQH